MMQRHNFSMQRAPRPMMQRHNFSMQRVRNDVDLASGERITWALQRWY
jgi:hypothetical protein